MEIQALGTYPNELSRRFILSSYLINGEISIDAGSLGLGLTPSDQAKVHTILLTHTHIDHIATLPLFLENCMTNSNPPPTLYSTPHNITMLKKHLFNNVIWPDLMRISSDFLRMVEIDPYEEITLPDISFHLFPVNHPIPTYGMILKDKRNNIDVLFTSDTTICDIIWIEANRSRFLKAIFIEISFPDAFRDLALSSGHLTPSLLANELKKLRRNVPIYLTHYKRQFMKEIEEELAAISGFDLRICKIGEKIIIE